MTITPEEQIVIRGALSLALIEVRDRDPVLAAKMETMRDRFAPKAAHGFLVDCDNDPGRALAKACGITVELARKTLDALAMREYFAVLRALNQGDVTGVNEIIGLKLAANHWD